MKNERNLSASFLTKQGKYGSTYGVPEIVFDFICSSSVLAKYNLINMIIFIKNHKKLDIKIP